MRQERGRPRDVWAIAPGANPAGEPPQAHAQLSRWLTRALGAGGDLERVERTGREIGRELGADAAMGDVEETMGDALAALGFAPVPERGDPDRLRFVLGNCPYREAVRQDPAVVCTLHRGLTQGLLDRLAPSASLAGFVAKDPYAAGCLIELAGLARN